MRTASVSDAITSALADDRFGSAGHGGLANSFGHIRMGDGCATRSPGIRRELRVTAQEAVGTEAGGNDQGIAVDVRVRVHPDSDDEARGVVVDDFGDSAGYAVEIGESRIVDAARRWAVLLDSGSLMFVNTDQLLPE